MENHIEKAKVTKANRLIEARYKLNLVEQKLILFAISRLDTVQKDFNIQRFSLKELSDVIGEQEHRYSEIRRVVRELRKKEVIINTPEKELITGWLSSIVFEKNTGMVELEFSKNLAPYLLELSGAYKSYQLENVIQMKSAYAIRIYEMLKQWECKKTQTYTVEELRRRLTLEKQYTAFKDFERRVIEPAKAEINEHSDLWVTYRKVKKGRTIDSIEFEIERKYGTVDTEAEDIKFYKRNGDPRFNYLDEIREKTGIEAKHISDVQLMECYELAVEKTSHPTAPLDVYDYMRLNFEYTISKAKNGVYGYFKKALETDYAKARNKLALGE